MAVSAGIAVLFDAHVFTDYRAMLQSASVENQFMPTLGGYLRARLGLSWLQILPAILGVTGTLIHYACHARRWLWREQMPLLLLGSILCAPYAWLLDEVVLLAALIPAAAAVKPSLVRALGAAFVLVNLGILIALAAGFRVVSSYYLWTIWVWMAFYFVSKQIYWKDQVRVS